MANKNKNTAIRKRMVVLNQESGFSRFFTVGIFILAVSDVFFLRYHAKIDFRASQIRFYM